MGSFIVTLKNGKKHRADTIDHLPGFIKIMRGGRELRVPAGDVIRVDNTEMREFSRYINWGGYFAIFFVVFLFVLLLV